jgi:hypothetical protein
MWPFRIHCSVTHRAKENQLGDVKYEDLCRRNHCAVSSWVFYLIKSKETMVGSTPV